MKKIKTFNDDIEGYTKILIRILYLGSKCLCEISLINYLIHLKF